MAASVHDAIGLNDGSAAELRERIKELSCLYALARVAQEPRATLRATLDAVLAIIPQGWQWPEHLRASLTLDADQVGDPPLSTRRLTAPIVIDGSHRGLLVVAYPDDLELHHQPVFLPEEEQLLDKLALEVASIVERYEQREHQAMLDRHLLNTDRLTVLSELTAGIAHELNTPLGNVLGFAELLKRGETVPARQADLQRIIDSALAGREIVKKLMYFSCEMPSQFHLLDVNEQVRQTVRLLQHRSDERAVRIEVNLCSHPLVARIDAVQFAQVISNLVLNALGAMPNGGSLQISTQRSAEYAIVHVQDTGSGIAEEHVPRIFQPFFTTKPPGEGTGLGLSVVHGIMKAHGGHITVSSTPGSGTLFTISFPLPQQP